MDFNTFFLRLMCISGRKLPSIRHLSLDPTESVNVEEVFYSLDLLPKQKAEFWQCDERLLENALQWLCDPLNTLITYLDPRYPPLLKEISSAPLALFVRGNAALLQTPQLAVVGSRQFTEYGQQVTYQFATEIAAAGITITSGLALGIDSIAHRGALEGNGATIAVLGSGINRISPRSHIPLAEKIIEQNGAIVSEFFPETQAQPTFFPRRNRIVSGLAQGVFIAEAGAKSGSLITARYALEQNRDVFALPGEILNPNSFGTNWLIQQGAFLVMQAAEILFHYDVEPKPVLSASNNTPEKTQNSLYPEIVQLLSRKPLAVDVIAKTLQQPITEIMIKLVELELAGEILRSADGVMRS